MAAAILGKMIGKVTGSKRKGVLSYGLFLIVPTVWANSALWAQCDIIFMTFLLLCFYFLFEERPCLALFFYGLAFVFKLQSLFIFPFLVILWVRRKVDLKHFVTIPIMYLVGIFPAWLAGRPFMELLGIYAFQGGKDRWSLSIKFPNIYQIIGNNFFLDEYVKAGMLLILGILMLVMCYMAYQKVRITKEFVILLVVFFGMLTTYFIPHMHERYLYLTDAFLLIYTLIRVRRFPLFVTASFLTVVGYGQYLTKQAPLVAYGALAFIQLALLVLISLDVYRYLHDPANVLEGGTLESDRIESERTEGRAGL